jgi:hypothetical protein
LCRHHDITEILFKVALNTTTLTPFTDNWYITTMYMLYSDVTWHGGASWKVSVGVKQSINPSIVQYFSYICDGNQFIRPKLKISLFL